MGMDRISRRRAVGRAALLAPLALFLSFSASACATEGPPDEPEAESAEEEVAPEERVERRTADEDPSGSEEASPAAAEEAVLVPEGTVMTVRLDETVSTDSHQPGDEFSAQVDGQVRGPDGQVVIPEGASVVGTVEESRPGSGPEEQSVLGLRLESVEVDGEQRPITATIQNATPEQAEGDSGAETAAKIAIGTAAGAVLGQIVGGDTESTVGGAAAGAVAGTVVALTSREGDATLNEGSTFRVQLDEPIREAGGLF